MNTAKQFPLRDLLTVTTGRLLTDGRGNGISDLYEILGWMTNDSPCTHQLGRFADECKPWLLRWFPEIEIAETRLDKLDGWLARVTTSPDEAVALWLAELQEVCPTILSEYAVPRIPVDDHTQKNAYDELVEMRGTDERIVLLGGEKP